jgi:hypothetical protein
VQRFDAAAQLDGCNFSRVMACAFAYMVTNITCLLAMMLLYAAPVRILFQLMFVAA